MIYIKISEEYTRTPGPRLKLEGDYSGEDFRETFLVNNYKKAIENNEKICVDLDGGYGYSPSFLEEAFGGLARIFDETKVNDIFEFVSNDEPSLVDDIREYIKNARKQKKSGEKS